MTQFMDLPSGVRVARWVDMDPSVVLGPGTIVWSFAVLCPGVQTGARCVVGSHVYIGRQTVLGDDVHIQDGAHLTDRMSVGSRVFVGPHVLTMNDRYPRVGNREYVVEPPVIEDDVVIGSGAIILPGIHIRAGAFIAAGAVVTRSVPAGALVKGNPARAARLAHRGGNA